MKKNKKTKEIILFVVFALILGILIGVFINGAIAGKAGSPLEGHSTLTECCYGLNSEGLDYSDSISEACCILINMGFSEEEAISDSCTVEEYNQSVCDSEFKNLINKIN